VTNGRKYYYQVTAENRVGEGTESNEATATPNPPPPAPPPPPPPPSLPPPFSAGSIAGPGPAGLGQPPAPSTTGIARVLIFGKAVIGSDGKARVRVRCTTRPVARCRGSLSATLVDVTHTAGTGSVRFRAVRFSIGSLGNRTIVAVFNRSVAGAVGQLSAQQLANRRLRVTAVTTVAGTRLRQTALLHVTRGP
jgi:hypothetical protein